MSAHGDTRGGARNGKAQEESFVFYVCKLGEEGHLGSGWDTLLEWSGARGAAGQRRNLAVFGELVSEKPTQSGSAAWGGCDNDDVATVDGTRLKGCEPVTSGAKSAATGSAGERQTRGDWARKEQVRRDQL
ncbi:hypothetical protein ERJ75_000623200 [Trypanosoma vivax]|nr:hypothetical protein ERJ75_000623200 [Trypanosoma vivax]